MHVAVPFTRRCKKMDADHMSHLDGVFIVVKMCSMLLDQFRPPYIRRSSRRMLLTLLDFVDQHRTAFRSMAVSVAEVWLQEARSLRRTWRAFFRGPACALTLDDRTRATNLVAHIRAVLVENLARAGVSALRLEELCSSTPVDSFSMLLDRVVQDRAQCCVEYVANGSVCIYVSATDPGVAETVVRDIQDLQLHGHVPVSFRTARVTAAPAMTQFRFEATTEHEASV